MIKICQIVPCFPYREHLDGQPVEMGYHIGGVEKHVYYLCQELAKLGNEVTVITTKSPSHDNLCEIESNLNIYRVSPGISLYASFLPFQTLKVLKPGKYHMIHAHTPTPAIADIAALKNYRQRCPFVLTYHNDITKGGILGSVVSAIYNTTLGAFLLRHTDAIIATTKSYAEQSKRLKKHLPKVKLIPNGVDIEQFRPNIDGNRIREEYKLHQDSKIVLFTGRIDSYKGCDYLVRAFGLIANELPQAHLLFVGTGPLMEKMKMLSKDLNIAPKVIFAGYVPDKDLPYYYAACDVFTLPSISSLEGFGIVQLEAMACGKPVITTTLPGPHEVDAEGVATIHVLPRNEEALAKAILKTLTDKKLAETMGKNGRKLVEEKYSWSRVAQSTQELYHEVFSCHHHGGLASS